MSTLKILHFADAHVHDRDIDECRKCLEFIVPKAREEKPDLVVFAGDALHSRDTKLDSAAAKLVIRIFSELGDVAPVVIVRGTPSHDGNAPEILEYVKSDFPIHVATRPEQIYLRNGTLMKNPESNHDTDLVISCLPEPTKQFFQQAEGTGIEEMDQAISNSLSSIFIGFAAQASKFNANHILVYHGTVRGAVTSTGQQMIGREIEVSKEQIALANADLVCLGHIHKAQQIGENAFYAGSIYRENIGEQEDKGFYIHTLSEGSWQYAQFIPTPAKKILAVKIDATSQAFDLQAGLADADFAGGYVRVEVKAWQDETGQIDKESIERELLAKGASSVDVRIIRVPREVVRSSKILKLFSLRDKIQELAATRGEVVTDAILEKADELENLTPDEIIEEVSNA